MISNRHMVVKNGYFLWMVNFPQFCLKTLEIFVNFKNYTKQLSRPSKYLRAILVISEVKGILIILKIWGAFVCFGLYFSYFISLWVFQSFPSFDGDILVILEALVVIIGYLVVFINIWDNEMHPSCAKLIFKFWPLYCKSGVRYWFWQILSLIGWSDCVNRVN